MAMIGQGGTTQPCDGIVLYFDYSCHVRLQI